MTATLEADFESKLRDAVMGDVLVAAEDIGEELMDVAEANFKRYARTNGYDIDHIWQDAEGPTVRFDGETVTIRVEWPGLTALFEWGVSPHTIEGNPLLSFVWEGPPGGTRPEGAPKYVETQSVNWGSVTGGIEASHAIARAIQEVGRDL